MVSTDQLQSNDFHYPLKKTKQIKKKKELQDNIWLFHNPKWCNIWRNKMWETIIIASIFIKMWLLQILRKLQAAELRHFCLLCCKTLLLSLHFGPGCQSINVHRAKATFLSSTILPPEHHIVKREAKIRTGWQNLCHLDLDLYFLIISLSHTLEKNHLWAIQISCKTWLAKFNA